MKHLLRCLILPCLFVLGTTPAHAVRHRKTIKSEATITAASSTSVSVKLGSSTRVYKISSTTTIHIDGAKAGAGDLKKGMRADITVSQIDPDSASAIEASRP